MKKLHLLGYASDIAGAAAGSAKGPLVLRQSPYLAALENEKIKLSWGELLQPAHGDVHKVEKISYLCQQLAEQVAHLTREKKFFVVLGGDHSSAIGTWSGASHALKKEGSLGLIWVDAHMDSHTPQTSETGNIHGMPLACLLGQGASEFIHILDKSAKLNPENVSLIGVRSFEPGEEALLKKLNVRVFLMDEIKQRGLEAVMQEAIQRASHHTAGFGISIDVDSIDPQDAPGTGVAEPGGISGQELCNALSLLAEHPKLIGAEIAEFDPSRDKQHLTEKLISSFILSLAIG